MTHSHLYPDTRHATAWFIQWRGPNGRSPWRKCYPQMFASEVDATKYLAGMMGAVTSPNFRIAATRETRR